MDIDLAVLADAATVDRSGKLNILGVMDRIQAREFPIRHGRLALVLRFSADPGEVRTHRITIRLRDPEDSEVLKVNGKVELSGTRDRETDHLKVPQVLNLDGIQFPGPGEYRFEVSVDQALKATLPLRLQLLPQTKGESTGELPTGREDEPTIVLVTGDPAEA